MPSSSPVDKGDQDFDEDRSRALRSIVNGLKHGFVVPQNPDTPESDFGSTAGVIYEQLRLDGFEVVER